MLFKSNANLQIPKDEVLIDVVLLLWKCLSNTGNDIHCSQLLAFSCVILHCPAFLEIHDLFPLSFPDYDTASADNNSMY
jgi:hypothetical protein